MREYLPRTRAEDRITAIADWRPVGRALTRRAQAAPKAAVRAVAWAASWWLGMAKPRIPVRASVTLKQKRAGARGGLYSKQGRGMLRKTTRQFVQVQGGKVTGGIISEQHYAIWLLAGTRTIAGGALLRWNPGDPTITDWPAKRGQVSVTKSGKVRTRKGQTVYKHRGGNPRGELPIIIPWHHLSRDKLVGRLKETV